MINLLLADCDELADPKIYERIYNALLPKRRIKVDKLKNDKAKKQSVAVFSLLLYGLTKNGYLKSPTDFEGFDKLGYVIGEHGKPYLKNENLFFSCSHSENRAICMIADKPVGCDIEYIHKKDYSKLSKRMLTENEYDYVVNQGTAGFYSIWTLKESYLKMTGEGLSRKLNGFEVNISPEPNGNISITDSFDASNSEKCRFYLTESEPGYVIGACIKESPDEKISVKRISLKAYADLI